ncbi:MAG: hypothetical protein RSG50_12060, partial [Clostridia bacterium]
ILFFGKKQGNRLNYAIKTDYVLVRPSFIRMRACLRPPQFARGDQRSAANLHPPCPVLKAIVFLYQWLPVQVNTLRRGVFTFLCNENPRFERGFREA